jgi:phosphate transport system substrate-binding protein
MKTVLKLIVALAVSLSLFGCSQDEHHITGAGSSFIYPALSIWAKNYDKQTNIEVNYQAIGSGGGLQQIYSGTIDFAASDMPLTTTELTKHGLQQFPMLIGGIVIAVNIPGIKNNQLTLSGDTLEKIYMGNIQYWDDQAIIRLNPGVKLPHDKIVSIHRADGSGTTFNFTNYLAKVSSQWQKHIGTNTTVAWPGDGIGAKGNAGVAAQVMQTPNSIGYVEYAYAKQNNMVITKMLNRSNKVITANAASFAAAAQHANWQAKNGFYQILTDQSGADSWPIVATTFVLIPTEARSPKIKQEVFKFFKWCFLSGNKSAEQLDYVAVPISVYQKILATFK